MSSRPSRAWATVVAASLAVVVAVAPVAAADPVTLTERPPKAIPTTVEPYIAGAPITVNTDILSVSDYPAWAIDEFLAAKTPLPPIGMAFVKAERDYGVNALALLGIAMLESGYGSSYLARVKRNLFGFNALDRDPIGAATTFPSYEACVDYVAKFLRDEYLSPSGGMWGAYPTLRAVNLAYATDPGWADKIARIATSIDRFMVTLRERGVSFSGVAVAPLVLAGSKTSLTVKWKADKGEDLPSRLLYAVRWTPVAIAEDGIGPAAALAAPDWRITDTTDDHHVLGFTVKAPKAPGLWRLEVDPRDTDGAPLPASDHPKVRSALLRVVAADEAVLTLGSAGTGKLSATIRAAGRKAVRAKGADGADVSVEAWALPLDPAKPATRLGAAKLTDDIPAGSASPWSCRHRRCPPSSSSGSSVERHRARSRPSRTSREAATASPSSSGSRSPTRRPPRSSGRRPPRPPASTSSPASRARSPPGCRPRSWRASDRTASPSRTRTPSSRAPRPRRPRRPRRPPPPRRRSSARGSSSARSRFGRRGPDEDLARRPDRPERRAHPVVRRGRPGCPARVRAPRLAWQAHRRPHRDLGRLVNVLPAPPEDPDRQVAAP